MDEGNEILVELFPSKSACSLACGDFSSIKNRRYSCFDNAVIGDGERVGLDHGTELHSRCLHIFRAILSSPTAERDEAVCGSS